MVQPYDMLLKHIKEQIPLTAKERTQLKNTMNIKWDGTTSLQRFVNQMVAGMKAASFWNWKVSVQLQDAVDHLVQQIFAAVDPFDTKVMVMTDWETSSSSLSKSVIDASSTSCQRPIRL